MPHSSGGGSSSGGCHSSSGGGGYGGSRGPRISKDYYPNARRFRYYDRSGYARYVYCSSMPPKQSIFMYIITMIFMIPFILSGLFMGKTAVGQVMAPKPLKAYYIQTDVHINDELNVIDNKEQVERSLKDFEKQTGISPYIMTVYDEEWKPQNSTLEQYAYSLYVNKFTDEQHFLIVYSQPKGVSQEGLGQWSWEGMQGNDTDPILTASKFRRFQEELQKDLTLDSISTDEAFVRAFDSTKEYIMKGSNLTSQSLTPVIMCVVWNLFILYFIVNLTKGYINSKRDYQEVPLDNTTSYNNY